MLKNQNFEIHIDLPKENYNFSRFDWTGKIVKVIFKNVHLTGVERIDCENEDYYGKGLFNEFGIDSPLGFDETEINGWFHKIGVGLLKKDDNQYLFNKKYTIKPARFNVITGLNTILISCHSEVMNGYSYVLRKEIELHESSFTIHYYLENTGDKDIITQEYVHNFISINKDAIGSNYLLKFQFLLKPGLFGEVVNPEQKIALEQKEVIFNGTPTEQFFFSKLTGNEYVAAKWELIHQKSKIVFSETGSFKTNKVNLWGWKHVISPELFYDIYIKPGQATRWSRTFNAHKIV